MLEARLIAWAAATLRQPCALKFAAMRDRPGFYGIHRACRKAAAPDKSMRPVYRSTLVITGGRFRRLF